MLLELAERVVTSDLRIELRHVLTEEAGCPAMPELIVGAAAQVGDLGRGEE